MLTVLGIDPSSTATGWGVVQYKSGKLIHHAHGVIRPRGETFERRIGNLYSLMCDVFDRYQIIQSVGMERPISGKHAYSSLKVGEAAGACISAARRSGFVTSVYNPSEVKRAITHDGAADKKTVAATIKMLLKLDSTPPLDASDALAVAIVRAMR